MFKFWSKQRVLATVSSACVICMVLFMVVPVAARPDSCRVSMLRRDAKSVELIRYALSPVGHIESRQAISLQDFELDVPGKPDVLFGPQFDRSLAQALLSPDGSTLACVYKLAKENRSSICLFDVLTGCKRASVKTKERASIVWTAWDNNVDLQVLLENYSDAHPRYELLRYAENLEEITVLGASETNTTLCPSIGKYESAARWAVSVFDGLHVMAPSGRESSGVISASHLGYCSGCSTGAVSKDRVYAALLSYDPGKGQAVKVIKHNHFVGSLPLSDGFVVNRIEFKYPFLLVVGTVEDRRQSLVWTLQSLQRAETLAGDFLVD